MCKDNFKRLFFSIFFLFSLNAYSLPIDWHGTFGVDSTSIDQYRRLDQKTTSTSIDTGSQEVGLATGEHHRASWQSYVFKLSPEIVINDAASFKGEISNGYGRGGRLGDNPYKAKEGTTSDSDNNPGATFGNSLYYYNTSFPGTDQKLLLNKFYMELYSDTATYLIGRHANHWGMGAIVNEGKDRWDRHTSTRDGVTMKLKIGNFMFEPFWAKMDSIESLTRATNSRHWGIGILYDNVDRDISFGLLYTIMKIAKSNTNQQFNMGTAASGIGESNVKLIDLYFKKQFGKLSLEAEAPIFGGEMGPIYGSGEVKYKAKAVLFKSGYQLNKSWKMGLHAGTVSGDEGGQSSFEAMYLHPNFQIANLLFRYNRRAISDPNSKNVYDSYMSNAQYIKLAGTYESDKWVWETAFIYAKANQAATQGSPAFNHTTNKTFTAAATQDKDLGMELDFNFKYKWNTEVLIDGGLGYLFTGDYFGFNNTSTPLVTKNSYVLQLRASVDF